MNHDGDVLLRRGPQDGYVVSYNPCPLTAHQCHVRMTALSGPRVIPFICKFLDNGYTHPGSDLVSHRKKPHEQGSEQPVNIGLAYMHVHHRRVSYSKSLLRFLQAPLVCIRWLPMDSSQKLINQLREVNPTLVRPLLIQNANPRSFPMLASFLLTSLYASSCTILSSKLLRDLFCLPPSDEMLCRRP